MATSSADTLSRPNTACSRFSTSWDSSSILLTFCRRVYSRSSIFWRAFSWCFLIFSSAGPFPKLGVLTSMPCSDTVSPSSYRRRAARMVSCWIRSRGLRRFRFISSRDKQLVPSIVFSMSSVKWQKSRSRSCTAWNLVVSRITSLTRFTTSVTANGCLGASCLDWKSFLSWFSSRFTASSASCPKGLCIMTLVEIFTRSCSMAASFSHVCAICLRFVSPSRCISSGSCTAWLSKASSFSCTAAASPRSSCTFCSKSVRSARSCARAPSAARRAEASSCRRFLSSRHSLSRASRSASVRSICCSSRFSCRACFRSCTSLWVAEWNLALL
mmetsp:Transcript_18780/g.33219  ORF Transcript_18780/g.33219 Transcript_18780/m.33219 type:complete len:328 (+) Transcript_18780:949-1932(+)